MSNADQTQRFLFENSNIRGELTGLKHSYQQVLNQHDYPKSVQILLGQFMAASALLANMLKFEGRISLQVSSSGQIRTLMADCRNRQEVRAIARYHDDFCEQEPLLGQSQLAITLEPEQGKRYQGIVALAEGEQSLAQALEDYFRQSEQISTRLWLAADGNQASGLLLQTMPTGTPLNEEVDTERWNRIGHLAATLKPDELLQLDNPVLLNRLFHEEPLRLFNPTPLCFACSCSQERCAQAIMTLGKNEAWALLAESGHIQSDCQFCHQSYWFHEADLVELFGHKMNLQ